MAGRWRRRIEQSDWFPRLTGGAAAAWAMACVQSTRWRRDGDADVAAALAEGPVIVLLWHEMVMTGPAHWRGDWGPLVTLHEASPAGRAGAAGSARMGGAPFILSSRQSDMGTMRDILGELRAGRSLAVTGDGPRGPRRVLKDAGIDWARAAGVPVFTYAWAQAGMRRAGSWDRLQLLRPMGRGGVVFRRWEGAVPRRMDAATREALRADLAAALTRTAEAAARLAEGGA